MTCSSLDVTDDCGWCQERCDCDDGFLLSAGRCVNVEDCGCWVEGQHFEVNTEKHQEKISTQVSYKA